MGRKYYCDYCDKRLPSGSSHRKSHNRGSQHINNKLLYYLRFQDPVEILINERLKTSCIKWKQSNSCLFGNNCKFSHRSNYELFQLIEQAKQNLNNQNNFDVHRWIQRKLSNESILPESLVS
ncbi:unnamed protein product [Rotaria magnacalcarata]